MAVDVSDPLKVTRNHISEGTAAAAGFPTPLRNVHGGQSGSSRKAMSLGLHKNLRLTVSEQTKSSASGPRHRKAVWQDHGLLSTSGRDLRITWSSSLCISQVRHCYDAVTTPPPHLTGLKQHCSFLTHVYLPTVDWLARGLCPA